MLHAHKDRGRVLLAVRVHSVGRMLFQWVATILMVCGVPLVLILKPHKWQDFLLPCLFLSFYLSRVGDYLFYHSIKFQEGGVEIPINRDCPRVRFMTWKQIYRWSWDGDLLILTGAYSQGGAVRIPETERLAVDELIGSRLAVR
jgi:hypothetical protein